MCVGLQNEERNTEREFHVSADCASSKNNTINTNFLPHDLSAKASDCAVWPLEGAKHKDLFCPCHGSRICRDEIYGSLLGAEFLCSSHFHLIIS